MPSRSVSLRYDIPFRVSFRDTALDKLRIAVNWRRDRSVNAKTNANATPVHFNARHGEEKKSITYCNVRNEILRLIKHSYLACDGRDGHCSKEETAEARAVAISLTSKLSAKVSQTSPAWFSSHEHQCGKRYYGYAPWTRRWEEKISHCTSKKKSVRVIQRLGS